MSVLLSAVLHRATLILIQKAQTSQAAYHSGTNRLSLPIEVTLLTLLILLTRLTLLTQLTRLFLTLDWFLLIQAYVYFVSNQLVFVCFEIFKQTFKFA